MLKAQPSSATTLSVFEISSLLDNLKLREIMSSPVFTVEENCPLEEAAAIILNHVQPLGRERLAITDVLHRTLADDVFSRREHPPWDNSGMDGYAVLQELRNHPETCDIPVIALSADAMPIDIESGLKAGFRDYLTKPVQADVLLGTLEKLLRH